MLKYDCSPLIGLTTKLIDLVTYFRVFFELKQVKFTGFNEQIKLEK